MKILLSTTLLALSLHAGASPVPPPQAAGFAANPIVYFVLTDRFHNGNPGNDASYGRTPGKGPGDFHGGDLAGLTQKLKAGYFRDLGVNALWISAPYEQIHGWVVGGKQSFKHYAYHGYWALDYTLLDKNMGTPAELRELVDTAHAQGIRILFDVVINHPGYADLHTLAEYKIPVLWKGWEKATLRDYHSLIDYNNFAFKEWWGPDWVRAGLPGYVDGGRDDETMQLAYLPDFRTERDKAVSLPPILKKKADTRARDLPNTSVRGYLVQWLADWVREYGIDGFRCDTVKHVEAASWLALKQAASKALAEWKANNPAKKIDDAPFWMTGEAWGHGPQRSHWHEAGFDSMINFDFQSAASADWLTLDKTWLAYANALQAQDKPFDILSYISSHDTALFARDKLRHGVSALLLTPGGVQLFYGDESARPNGAAPEGDPQQATRSPMNWDSMDKTLLQHAQKLTQFRARHVAIARGEHMRLSEQPYAFMRVDAKRGDMVLVAPQAQGDILLPAGRFAEGQALRDAYSGQLTRVKQGKIALQAQGSVLLEIAE
ncbi:alpha-amylase family glycosyl hydrolase [Massilia sp. W12]|uniref:alpha-amylase family glycosyl hydrolase n=1 Tax=Massilia sp. W12 TaxID=3126507 RepID=UPI0030D60DC1